MKLNGTKMVLVPRFATSLLYSQKILLLNIFHAKFQGQTQKASLGENRMFYDMRSAQITQDF